METSTSSSHSDLSILAVEEDAQDLSSLTSSLSKAGYQIQKAHNGRQALEQIERTKTQLLLVELNLPDMSGLDVLRVAQRKDQNATGIVLTRSGSYESAVQCLNEGAFDFLVKPYGFHLLNASVSRAAQHYHLKHSLYEKTAQLNLLKRKYNESVSKATAKAGSLNENLQDFMDHLKGFHTFRNQLLTDVTHELKNPLTVISGYSNYLMDRFTNTKLPDELHKGLAAIHKNSLQLQSLVEDILDTTRLETGKIQLHREPVPMGEFLNQVTQDFQIPAQKKAISLSCQCANSDSLRAQADPKRLRQIVDNLVSNALKFTPTNGRVRLNAWRQDSLIVCSVEDNGKGISPEDRAHIFERFYQAETISYEKGLGLGLQIIKGLVELHGGKIWVESKVKSGSRFYFTLPATDEIPDPAKFLQKPQTATRYLKP